VEQKEKGSPVRQGWMDGWMVGWMVGWMDGWLDGWLDGWSQLLAARGWWWCPINHLSGRRSSSSWRGLRCLAATSQGWWGSHAAQNIHGHLSGGGERDNIRQEEDANGCVSS
jgi:hypothetical protein